MTQICMACISVYVKFISLTDSLPDWLIRFVMACVKDKAPSVLLYTSTCTCMNNQSKRCLERQGNNNTTERQSNTTQLARNSQFSRKNWLPRVGLKPMTISLLGDALTN